MNISYNMPQNSQHKMFQMNIYLAVFKGTMMSIVHIVQDGKMYKTYLSSRS